MFITHLYLNRGIHMRSDVVLSLPSTIWASTVVSSPLAAAGSFTLLHRGPSQPIVCCPRAQPEAFFSTLCWCRVWLVVADMTRSVSHSNQNHVEVTGFLCRVCHRPGRAGQLVLGGSARRGFEVDEGPSGSLENRARPHLSEWLVMNADTDLILCTQFKFFLHCQSGSWKTVNTEASCWYLYKNIVI